MPENISVVGAFHNVGALQEIQHDVGAMSSSAVTMRRRADALRPWWRAIPGCPLRRRRQAARIVESLTALTHRHQPPLQSARRGNAHHRTQPDEAMPPRDLMHIEIIGTSHPCRKFAAATAARLVHRRERARSRRTAARRSALFSRENCFKAEGRLINCAT